jgi:hypothetical protein
MHQSVVRWERPKARFNLGDKFRVFGNARKIFLRVS